MKKLLIFGLASAAIGYLAAPQVVKIPGMQKVFNFGASGFRF